MTKIAFNLSKSLHENANLYFSKAKKLKQKLPGIERTVEKTQKEIEELQHKQTKEQQKHEKHQLIQQHKPKKWYDKFRSSQTSSGKLIVIGKDAGTNEILIKKHMEENDIVFHTSAPGSPFAIIKEAHLNKELQISKEELIEAGQFLCAFSSQWKRGFGTADCFWVYPEQITKQTQSGEFIGKGSFMVYGKKNELKNVPLQICLGITKENITTNQGDIQIEQPISGSRTPIEKLCNKKYVILEPGQDNYKKLNKEIKKHLKTTIEELPKYIPNGCRITKK